MTAPDQPEPVCGRGSCTPDCGMGHCYLTDGTYIDPEDDHKPNEQAGEHAASQLLTAPKLAADDLRDRIAEALIDEFRQRHGEPDQIIRDAKHRTAALAMAEVQPVLDTKDAEIKRLHVEVSRFRQAWEDAMADGDQQAVQRLSLRKQLSQERQRAEAAERRVANLQATLTEVTSNNDWMRAELDVFRAYHHQIGDL